MRRHEELSKLIFKKILLDHPLVLANFIAHGLRKTHVEIIESMIDPDMDKIKEKIVCIKKSIIIMMYTWIFTYVGDYRNQREIFQTIFLYEVYVSSYCYHVELWLLFCCT